MTEPSPPPKGPSPIKMMLIGFVVGQIGYLTITGGPCCEGSIAMFVAGITGLIVAEIARRGGSRRKAFWKSFVAILLATAIAGLVGRMIAGPMVFKEAFNRWPGSDVAIQETHRFGHMDNTALVVFQTDRTTLETLLNAGKFEPWKEAQEMLLPASEGGADADSFRRRISVGGVFVDRLPYAKDLMVYHHDVADSEMGPAGIKRMITLTWDPSTSRAYLVVAEF